MADDDKRNREHVWQRPQNSVLYDQLSQNLRAGVTVLWDAFKTYFTVAALLLGALAFLYGEDARDFGGELSKWIRAGVSLSGVLVTALAWLGIVRILRYQKAFLEAAASVERGEATARDRAVFSRAEEIFREKTKCSDLLPQSWFGSDALTFAVFFLFFVAFGALTVVSVRGIFVHSEKTGATGTKVRGVSAGSACWLDVEADGKSVTIRPTAAGEKGCVVEQKALTASLRRKSR